MPDQKDKAQDKKAMEQKEEQGEDLSENTVHEPQPGKKPKLERDEDGNVTQDRPRQLQLPRTPCVAGATAHQHNAAALESRA